MPELQTKYPNQTKAINRLSAAYMCITHTLGLYRVLKPTLEIRQMPNTKIGTVHGGRAQANVRKYPIR